MKFFHLSDLHIGLKLFNRDLMEDQDYILRQIVEMAGKEQPDAVVIAGDIYDKAVPSTEALGMFDRFMEELTAAVPKAEIMVISGNHDSAPRLNIFRRLLSRQRLHMAGLPPAAPEEYMEKVVMEDEYGRVNFFLLPFVRPSMVRQVVGVCENGSNCSYDDTVRRLVERETIDASERNVLVSHQFYLPAGTDPDQVERMDSEIRMVGNIDSVSAEILNPFDYAALGHIHKPMKVGKEVYRYSGTPLPVSVSEAGQEKGVVMVELGGKGDVRIRVLPLEPLRRIRVIRGALKEVLGQACEDYVTVVLTDQADLDVIDMQDRLRTAFPGLLEIRRECLRQADYGGGFVEEEEPDPFLLCCSFLGDPDSEEKGLLQDVIRAVQEAGK